MTSRVPARASLMTSESLNSDRLIAGSSRCDNPSRVRKLTSTPSTGTVSPRPVDGSQPSMTANSMIIMMPTQKLGRLKPRIEPAMMVRDHPASGRSPASTPSGMPSTTASSSAAIASSKVAGMRSMISCSAGWPKMKESPRSPWSALTTK